MMALREKLIPMEGIKKSLAERIKWPLKKTKVEVYLGNIEHQKRIFMEFLKVENISQSVDTGLAISRLENSDKDSRFEKVMTWLSDTDPSTNHNAARKKHKDRTGIWFTQGKKYQSWQEEPNSFLWLHGISGSGKTILCSEIIEQTLDFCSLPGPVLNLYESYKFSQPPIERLLSVLHALLELPISTEVFLVLDALDEFPNDKAERDQVCETLIQIKEWGLQKLHTIITSRPEDDLKKSMTPLTTSPPISIEDSVVKSDIQKFVKASLAQSKLKQWPVDVRDEIEDTLVNGADGMFRWVDCQLVSLSKCLTRNDIKKALKSLPKTLDETYERILTSVDEEHRPKLVLALKWISGAERPLKINELAEAIVIDPMEYPPFQVENRLPDPNWIVPILSSLVVLSARPASFNWGEQCWDPPATLLNFAHFSVVEYLTSDRILHSPASMFHMNNFAIDEACTKGSLQYLHSCFDSGKITWSHSDLSEFPLLNYASEFWYIHASSFQGLETSEVNKLTLEFLLSEKNRKSWLWFHNPQKMWIIINSMELNWWDPLYVSLDDVHNYTPLYLAAILGLTSSLKTLINQGFDIDQEGGFYGTALQGAVSSKKHRSVDMLLDAGADANRMGFDGTANNIAADRADSYTIKRLLETGVDLDVKSSSGETPLERVSNHANVDTDIIRAGPTEDVKRLLELGADANLPTNENGKSHPLEAAVYSGKVKTLNMLFEAGAVNDVRGASGYTPLERVVERLIFTDPSNQKEIEEIQERRLMAKCLLD
ncbi:hypothetical protein HYALB_00010848 [Hymenoscyphus albidus]|uniref:Nephrocystin 3-like N-terminal domain-containing protein n=1 Tax=Hymenoscyphus albidus TaxID=595503 RepID=A0A9N9LGE4_9HELO|nr:hypothetical protein HYALB_00010848 [Hymenoscyphus albidus]